MSFFKHDWFKGLRDVLSELPGLPEYRRHDWSVKLLKLILVLRGLRTKDWHSGLALQAVFKEHRRA